MTKINIQNDEIQEDVREALSAYSDLVQRLLVNRGITEKGEADKFLNPDWERDTHDPFLIHDMEKAVKRILKAVDKNEKIVIYGDYDCDGIPGSTILHDFFKKIGYENYSNYIPHRHNEGYGLGKSAVERFIKDKTSLIITVDVGITDIESIAFAQKNKVDVIVTDHHLPIIKKDKEILPDAFAILNSKKEEDSYPDDMLCGSGVAFKLVQALLVRGKEGGLFDGVPVGWEKWLLDMAGIATIADMVPLRKENRTFAYYGLKVITKNRRTGLRRLLQGVKIAPQHITEDDIGFMVAPRINAASRMDHPIAAFQLLSAADDAVAEACATHLEKLNDKRKGYVASMIKNARKRLESRDRGSVIVIGDTDWLPGVLGLAANKLVEEYNCPVFVWGHDEGGNIKGSCRTNGVSVMEIMRGAPEDTFLQFGGHDASAGFTLTRDSLHTLEDELSDVYKNMDMSNPDPLMVDAELNLDDVNWTTYNEMSKLAPFGMGNEKPVFLFREIEITDVRLFGKVKDHMGIEFNNSRGQKVSSIGFFMTKDSFPDLKLERGEKINLIGAMEKSMFRGRPELRLRIVDIISIA